MYTTASYKGVATNSASLNENSMGRKAKLDLDDETGADGHHCSTRRPILIIIAVVAVIIGLVCMAVFLHRRFRTDAEEWKGRLPRNLIPSYYQIYLKPYLYEEDLGENDELYTFDGRVTITMTCEIATDVITLHSRNITIRSHRLRDSAGNDVVVNDLTYELKYEFAHFHVDVMLEVDQDYVLVIDYVGLLADESVGLFRASYEQDGETKWNAASQLQSTSARRVFPCFDEPDIRAIFTTEIEHRVDMVALSNGIEESETVLDNGWRLTQYRASLLMPTYLNAFVIGYYNYTERYSDNGVRYRVWARPDKIEATRYALDVVVNMTTYFEQLFNITFELPKQDMIAASTKGGAMENWGLIIYSEQYLLYDSKIDTIEDKQLVALVISHELAHQWFGNLVTCKWWNDLWLNEGVTTFLETLGMDSAEPSWNVKQHLSVDTNRRTFLFDSVVDTSHALIRNPVNTTKEIDKMFDAITYLKGGAVTRMLENMLGEEVLMKGFRLYLKRHLKESVESDDLWSALTEADKGIGNNDVKKIMDTWTLQKGHPVVDIKRINNQQLNVSQKQRVLVDPENDVEGDQGYLWYIYLTYTQKTDANFEMPTSTWIEKVPWALVNLPPSMGNDDWYLVNVKQYGFYRVNYDDENWARLAKQLVDDHTVFPIENRAQMINDAFSLAPLGQLDYTIALNLTLFLVNEVEYVTWEGALSFFKYIREMLIRHPGYGHLERYMQQQVQNLYSAIGWNDNPDTDPFLEQMNRVNAIETACKYHNPDCLEEASELFHLYMQNDEENNENRTDSEINPISPNLRKIVYCYGIQEGGQREWDFGWKKLQDSDTEKMEWLEALSYSKEPWILNRYLVYSITYLEKKHSSKAIKYVSENSIGQSLAWDFVWNKWNELHEYHNDSFAVDDLVSDITKNFNTELELEELLAFGDYDDIAAKIRRHIAWMQDYAMKVTQWLEGATRDVGQ